MNAKLVRTISIALLMIVSTQIALLDTDVQEELKEAPFEAKVITVPSSGCLGDDACTGQDAGTTLATIIDLTSAVDWTPSATGTDTTFSGYLPTYGSAGNDIYMLTVPWGYQVEAITTWEDVAGSGTSVQDSIYWTGIYSCDTFDLGLYGGISTSPWGGSPCGIDDNYASTWPGPGTMSGDSASTVGTDVGGQDIFIQIYCWDCGWYSNPSITDYELTIRVTPSDGGMGDFGDWGSSTADTLYTCNHPSATAGTCLEIPDLILNFDMSWSGFATGVDETSTGYAADMYTIDIPPNHDAQVSLTIDCYNNCDAAYYQYAHLFLDGDGTPYNVNTGTHVNTGQGGGNSGYFILDLPLYGLVGDYWDSKSWLVSGADTFDIALLAVSPHLPSASGFNYIIDVTFEPAANAPCATADDGGSGDDAPDDDPYNNDDPDLLISGTSGVITGTICKDYDSNDYYTMSVPSGMGMFASLEWDDSDSPLYDGLDFTMTRDDGSGLLPVMDATKDDATVQSVSTNKSGFFMPGGLVTTTQCSLESVGSGYSPYPNAPTDSCSFTLNAGEMMHMELDTRAYGSEVMIFVTDPSGTQTQYGRNPSIPVNGASTYFATNSYYDLAIWEWTTAGDYTVMVTDSYGDGCTCTLDVYRDIAPSLGANNLVLEVAVDSLPDEAVVNYTITYDMYPVMMHSALVIPDEPLGADASATNPGTLYPANYTYTGYMHDAWDSQDVFEIFIPENYGITINVHSDFRNDIDIMSSMGNNLGGADPAGPVTMAYNPAFGGSTETITLDMEVGSGMYDLVVEMWNVNDGPDTQQNDAGLGTDAADHHLDSGSTNWALGGVNMADGTVANGEVTWLNSTTQNATGVPVDATFSGMINHVWDRVDAYRLAIPTGYYAFVNVTTDGNDAVATTLFSSPDYTAAWTNGNDEIASYCPSFAPGDCELTTDHKHEGNFVSLSIWSYQLTGDIDFHYDVSVEWGDISGLPCEHDDFGTCTDAPDIYTVCYGAAHDCDDGMYLNATVDVEHTGDGWAHSAYDSRDWYNIDIPHGYGLDLELDAPTGTNYDVYLYNVTTGRSFSSMTFGTYPFEVGTNDSSTWTGGLIAIYLRGSSYHDDDGTDDYTITYNLFTLDADGDTWFDRDEDACSEASLTNATYDPTNSSSFPPDNDADGICDELDDDDDNDGIDDTLDTFPLDPNESGDMDGDDIGDNADDDIDGDGWLNDDETDCLTDPFDSNSAPIDSDMDGICDPIDADLDGDGVDNVEDYYPEDAGASKNTDGDDYPDEIHPGWVENASAYIYDPDNSVYETTLMADSDDDNDGFSDVLEVSCQSDPLLSTSIPTDSDMDGTCDVNDDDIDGDGVSNTEDAFPLSPCASSDHDGDGKPDSLVTDCATSLVEDVDDDDDGFRDDVDAFPTDDSEWYDTDGDLIGNNADLNDDGDAWTDSEEKDCGSDSLDVNSVPDDYDGDGTCDKLDTDDDGDGVPDVMDAFPYDATENADFDGDGIGDYSDSDDDNDGWFDDEEPNCGTDSMDANSVPADNDMDRDCDTTDQDDDNDGVLDLDDDFPMNPAESNDLDGDGIGDNADTDDDGDGWLDTTENLCKLNNGRGAADNADIFPVDNETNIGPDGIYGTDDDFEEGDKVCNALDPDDDNDGVPDPAIYQVDASGHCYTCEDWEDHFPWDPTEQFDGNADGKGDNANKLTLIDDIRDDPGPFAGIGLAIALVVGLGARFARSGTEEDDEFDMYDETEEFVDEDEEDEEEIEA